MGFVNSNNQHTAFFTDTRNASKCNSLKGGKRRRKKRCKKSRKKLKKKSMKKHRRRETKNRSSSKAYLNGGAQGYGFTAESVATMGNNGSRATAPISMYKNCGLTPATSMRAGIPGGYVGTKNIQSGAGKGQGGGSRIGDFVKGLRNPFRVVKDLVNYVPRFTQAGGRRKSRTRKRKGKKRKGRRQRGGYAQYNSNIPLTSSLQTAVGPAKGSWEGQLASPPTYNRTNNCNDNYNHFSGKNTHSPILDQDVP